MIWPAHELGIRIATFNAWFSKLQWEKRQDGLVKLLVDKEDVHIICLQEVTPWFLARLLQLEVIQSRYRVSDCGAGRTIGRYGVMVLVDKMLTTPSLGWVSRPTYMGRSALMIHWGKRICVATVHLESLDSTKRRTRQLQAIHDELKFFDKALLAGDFNISATGPYANQDEHNQILHHLSGFADVWVREHGADGDAADAPQHFSCITFDNRMKELRGDDPPTDQPGEFP